VLHDVLGPIDNNPLASVVFGMFSSLVPIVPAVAAFVDNSIIRLFTIHAKAIFQEQQQEIFVACTLLCRSNILEYP